MILTAFDVKFHENKNEIPPEACRPLKKLKTNNVENLGPKKVKKTKNNFGKEGSPPVRPRGGSGGRRPPGREKRRDILIYIYIYILIAINSC